MEGDVIGGFGWDVGDEVIFVWFFWIVMGSYDYV